MSLDEFFRRILRNKARGCIVWCTRMCVLLVDVCVVLLDGEGERERDRR